MNILLKEKNLVMPTYLIPFVDKYSLNLLDFLLLIYFYNKEDENLDIKKIALVLKHSEQDVFTSFNNLMKKNLITIKTLKDDNEKIIEVVDLENLYNEISSSYNDYEKEKEEVNIYSIFESEFGRPISSIEYEIIAGWIEKGFSEELIKGALKEAVYNGVNNLRYIDKILYEWKKKGYKTLNDTNKDRMNKKEDDKTSNELFDYNWLEDEK